MGCGAVMLEANFTTFRSKVVELTERFDKYRDDYRRGYDESTLRMEYLNPFFRALGWDVDNDLGHPPHMRQVRVEYPAQDGTASRRADYAFRVGGMDRFVCEAKKFPERLDQAHFQAQNYAFNLRLWVSVLTNFDELHLFVVPSKPDKGNPFPVISGWRLSSFNYVDLARKIWDLLSYEAVASGSLERFVQDLPKASPKRGKQAWLIKPDRNKTVDAEFLQYLEKERVALAQRLVRDNPKIEWDVASINEAVQRTIDRLLFQRVCEDRQIDTYQTLEQSLQTWHASGRPKGRLWPTIVANYPNLRAAFNGGLFGRAKQKPHFTEKCVVDDDWLENFIDELTGDDSPYLFAQIPIEILGSVYERFLGSAIDTKGKVSEKPEVRKQGGVFYTPDHVVRYIVEKTIGPLVAGKTPTEIRRLKIIDPACGSGTFLISTLEKLSQACVEYYLANPKQRDPRDVYLDHNNDLRLTSEFKKQLAKSCVFGVDIDPQAVEVAEMSMYLKILENETRSTLSAQKRLFPDETFLPDLSSNLKVGNSLIDTDAYQLINDLDSEAVKPFSWQEQFKDSAGRFDAVVGNPPYDVIEKDRGEASWPHDVFRDYLDRTDRLDAAKGGKLNLFRFFLIQALQLCKPNGRIGMIVPMSIMADVSCKETRAAFLDGTAALEIDAFPQKDNKNHRIFYEAKLSTAILTAPRKAGRNKLDPKISLKVFPRNTFVDTYKASEMMRSELTALDAESAPIPLCDQTAWNLALKLAKSNSIRRLGEIKGIGVNRGEINQTTLRKFITSDPSHTRMLKGVEIARYKIKSVLSQGEVEWFNEKKFIKSHNVPAQVRVKRIATQRITGVDERLRIVATMAESNWFFADSTNSIVVTKECAHPTEYILALLNSKLFQWRFKITSTNNNVGTNELNALPVRDINTAQEIVSRDLIVSLVKNALRSASTAENTKSERARNSAEQALMDSISKIDDEIFKLYGLTAAEKSLVNAAVA